MKKILYSVLALAMAAFTFTSCEDVPMPYDDPNNNGGGTEEPTLPEGVYLDQSFTSSLGQFTTVSASGDLAWYNDYQSAMITGYQNKVNKAGVTFLVGPEIDLTSAEKAYVTINHAINYERGDINEDNSILISKNYNGDVNTATWELLSYDTEGLNTSFTFVEKSVNIPASYIGNKVVIALRHTCNASNSSTWEVKSLKVQEGEVESVGGDETPTDVILDQSFASSLGGFTSIATTGELTWYNDYSSAMITGFKDYDGDNKKENKAGVTYLVSPELDLTKVDKAYLTINHAVNYEKGDINQNNSVLISKNYNGDPNNATWEMLTYNTDGIGTSFTFAEKSVNIPASYIGSKVVIALRHTCTDTYSSTWEVKSLSIKAGEVNDNGNSGEVTENSITVIASSLGIADAEYMGSVTLSDGTVLAFEQNGNANGPKYYKNGTNIRMYPNNYVTITSASRKIASVIINCDEASGTIYNASGDISANPGTVSTNEKVITVNDINSISTTITNTSAGKGAPSQLRFVSLTINYAE